MESWTSKNLKVTSIIQLIQAKLLQEYEVTKFGKILVCDFALALALAHVQT